MGRMRVASGQERANAQRRGSRRRQPPRQRDGWRAERHDQLGSHFHARRQDVRPSGPGDGGERNEPCRAIRRGHVGRVALRGEREDASLRLDADVHAVHENDSFGGGTQRGEKQCVIAARANAVETAGRSYLKMIFITGVSKFARVSIFSDLNHLKDLTLNRNFGTLVGYTQTELEFYFADYIELTMERINISREELLADMREWYNGYCWDGENTVYNPFGILNFFDNKMFRNFWFTSGSPTFLIKLMRDREVFDFEDKHVNSLFLEKYDLDNIELIPLLFQTGYLTIKSMDLRSGDMVLNYPNKEVKDSMYQFLIDDIAPNRDSHTAGVSVQDLRKAFNINDLPQVKEIINTLFSDLPYNLHEMDKRKSERFFHGLIHLMFKYLGIFIDSEVRTYKGRADSIVQTDTHIYIFEFKVDKTAEDALEQLKKNGYANKYKLSGKEIIGIAVNFNSIEREIDGWIEERL